MSRLLHLIKKLIALGFLAGLALALYVFFVVLRPPVDFPTREYILVPSGDTVSEIGLALESRGVIRSDTWFTLLLAVTGQQSDLKSGTYYFENPQSLTQVIRTMVSGDFGVATARITILEGTASYQFTKSIADKLPFVSRDELETRIAKENKEGYLYPDTYIFSLDADTDVVINKIQENFDSKIRPFEQQIADSQYSMNEILTMASIIENEAGSASYEIKREVAGVLWRRIAISMPLQADAVFSFIYKQHLPRVLFVHLDVDSPYNVYKNKGLPPGPIGNPGINSIRAALDPISTRDLYYLTGFDGKFYFAQTLAEHERNRRLHLNYRN